MKKIDTESSWIKSIRDQLELLVEFMKKQILLLIALCMVFPFAAPQVFAQGTLQIETYVKSINTFDSILVVGEISGGAIHNPVTLTVFDPNGDILYKPSVAFGGDGKFSKVFHPPIAGFTPGTYTVTATQKEVSDKPELTFTVVGKSGAQSTGIMQEPQGLLSISADAVEGSSVITISGVTQSREGDVTVKVNAPNGNLVSIKQVTPSSRGQFSMEIITGGPLWTQDGQYTVTAFQGLNSEIQDSVQVEIQDGVVIPEFGSLVMIVLVVSIVSIIVLTSRFRSQIVSQI